MIIAGLQKTTLLDYPGKLGCIVFLAGCNFRCPWCYSSELVLPEKIIKQPKFPEEEIFNFLKSKQGLLEGVVICGGEPTINKDLPQFIEKIKKLGFAVKLDTNGTNPEVLKDLVAKKLIDYVAMDIKTTKEKYPVVFSEAKNIKDIEESVEFLKQGKVDFEFRTTCVPSVHKKEDFLEIAKWVGGENVVYYLQNFVGQKTIDPEFSAQGGPASGGEKSKPFPRKFLEQIAKEISPYFKICQVRN